MITLPASLAAHQRSPGRVPAVRVIARAERFGQPLLPWERLYTGAEADSPHAAAIAADGSLLRARNDAGNLRVSRVASPGQGSTYSSWTLLAGGLLAGSGVALAARSGECLLACTTGTALVVRTSPDNGATWSAPATVLTEASNFTWVAAAYRPNGDACLFYGLAGAPTQLKRLRRTAGAWAGAGTNWTNGAGVSAITGIAAAHNGGDFVIVVTGDAAAGAGPRAWAAIMGDGLSPANTWSALAFIAEADAASGTSYAGPSLCLPRPSTLRAAFRQRETGAVAFDRALETFPPGGSATGAWAEPWPHEATSAFGLALATQSTAAQSAWAATPSGVWRAAMPAAVDLSARVLACRYELGPGSARCRLLLDNADGLLSAVPNAAVPALLPGGTIEVSAGYASGAGGAAQFGTSTAFLVTRLRHSLGRNRRTLEAEAVGAWEVAGSTALAQAWQVGAGAAARGTTFGRLAAKAGLRTLTDSPAVSSDWINDQPAFAVTPGESVATALRRLLAVVSDGTRSGQAGAEFTVVGRAPGEPPVETFGGGGFPVTRLELSDEGAAANWVRLQGAGRYADAVDAGAVAQHGPRLGLQRNLAAGSDAKAAGYAAAALRRAVLGRESGRLVCPHHAGIELFDAVQLSDAGLGLAATVFRVTGIELDYRAGVAGGQYEATLTLGPL